MAYRISIIPPKKALLFIAGLFATTAMLLPLVWIVFTSFKTHAEIFASTPTFVPRVFSIAQYVQIFLKTSYPLYILNSLIVAASATIVVMVLAILAGYSYSKFFLFNGQGALLLFVLITRMVPPIAIVVPLYVSFASVGLLDTKLGLILISSAIALPLAIWMLKTFFDDVPKSLAEAAEIDGCGRLGALFHVILPLSGPAVASTITITFLTTWNLFLIPLIFGKSIASQTLPVAISALAFGEYGTSWGELAALSTVMIVPVALIGLFGQRYLTSGLTAGAEKG